MKYYEIIFSPTGGTQKVCDAIIEGVNKPFIKIDLCDPNLEYSKFNISKEDFSIIAMPSYGGRLPKVALERFKKIVGNGSKACIVVSYGNRDYDDTLLELFNESKKIGFNINAGICAISEHSIARKYAKNRPDEIDINTLKNIGSTLLNIDTSLNNVKGNYPYKNYSSFGIVPKPTKKCVKCLVCYEHCPVKAIDKNTLVADPKKCISCMRCIKCCPHEARKINSVMLKLIETALKKECTIRKEIEFYK